MKAKMNTKAKHIVSTTPYPSASTIANPSSHCSTRTSFITHHLPQKVHPGTDSGMTCPGSHGVTVPEPGIGHRSPESQPSTLTTCLLLTRAQHGLRQTPAVFSESTTRSRGQRQHTSPTPTIAPGLGPSCQGAACGFDL